MKKRKNRHAFAVLAAAAIGVFLGMGPLPGQDAGAAKGGAKKAIPKAAPKVGPVKRLSDGKPDMQGYWQTNNFFTAFDLETREKAEFQIPAGKGVVVDPADGKIPYQPWAMAKKKDLVDHHLSDDPQAHCYLSGVPRQMYTPFGFQIMQPPGSVVMFFEAFHAYRIIHLSGKHPDPAVRMFEGDSRGHWEGDTLVVDVANQNDRTWFDMAGNFHSEDIHLLERYTPVDANTINYEATITDPKVFTRPWKIAFSFGRNTEANYENLEFACTEGEQDLQHYTESQGGEKKDR